MKQQRGVKLREGRDPKDGKRLQFGPYHELWNECLELRAPPNYYSYAQIASHLHAKGIDVTTSQLGQVFNRFAPVALRLPERSGDYLRRVHAELTEGFDAWGTLKLLILDTLAELGAVNQKLEDESLGEEQREKLTDLRHSEIERAWRFTAELERLKRELDPTYIPALVRGAQGADPAKLVGAGVAAVFAGMNEIERRILDSLQVSDTKIGGLLGPTNVSTVGDGNYVEEEEV